MQPIEANSSQQQPTANGNTQDGVMRITNAEPRQLLPMAMIDQWQLFANGNH